MGRRQEGKIVLYEHPIGEELGLINLAIPAPYHPDYEEQIITILTSQQSHDEGVVFTVEMYQEDYDGFCEDLGIETLEGCLLSTFGDDISIEDVPEEPPEKRPNAKKYGTLHVLMTPNLWKHKWGRCCCVKRGDDLVPVTRDSINDGTVDFWHSPYTPYELDLIDAAQDSKHKAMHVLLDPGMICGRCGHNVWCVAPEDVPEELPHPPKYIEVDDSVLDDNQSLEEIVWASKGEAWEIFYDDDHNRNIIQQSKLAVERANKRKRYSQAKKFEAFNRAHGAGRKVYTVKQAFYAALGNTRTGTWADFDLKMLRMIKGLEQVDLPMEILDTLDLEDQDTEGGRQGKAEQHAVKATVDHDATILEFMLDREAAEENVNVEDDDDVDIITNVNLEDDENVNTYPAPEVQEPSRQQQDPRPKAVPRVKRSKKKQTERPTSKRRNKSKKTAAKEELIAACKLLQEALSSFVETLQDEDEPSNDDAQSTGP